MSEPTTPGQPTGLLPADLELTPARARLFTTAIVLFGERGYHGVSVRDITDALGQKPGALYAHVASKERLLFELVMIGHVEHRDRLAAAARAADADDAVARVTAIVRAHVLAHLAYPALARVTNHELRFLGGEEQAAVVGIRAESTRLLTDAIESGIRSGAFTAADPRLAVTAIGSMGMSTAEWWRPDLGVTPDEVADRYAGFAVNLLT